MSGINEIKSRMRERYVEAMNRLSQGDEGQMADALALQEWFMVVTDDNWADGHRQGLFHGLTGSGVVVLVTFGLLAVYALTASRTTPADVPASPDCAVEMDQAVKDALASARLDIPWNHAGTNYPVANAQIPGYACVRENHTGAFLCSPVPDPAAWTLALPVQVPVPSEQ